MQKVLEYKEHIEDREKAVLAQLRSQYAKLCSQLARMQAEYESVKGLYTQICRKGTVVRELAMTRSYLDALSDRMEQMALKIETVEQETDKQINKLTRISKEKSSMEKLKERHLLENQEKYDKEAEIFIDDFIANTTHYINR
jgi:flagellar FliJ protein